MNDFRLIDIEYIENKDEYFVKWHERKEGDRWRIKSVIGASDKKQPKDIMFDVMRNNGEEDTAKLITKIVESNITHIGKYSNWDKVFK